MKKDFREIVLEACVFILIFSINKRYTDGKRIRKKICKNLKKSLAKQKTYYSVNEWLYYVEQGQEIIAKAGDKMTLGEATVDKTIDPSLLLKMLSEPVGEKSYFSQTLIEDTGMNEEDISDFRNIYKDSNLSLFTLMFSNRLKKEISLITDYKKVSKEDKKKSLEYVKNL